MKATLQFNIPEEQNEFEYATKGFEYACVVTEIMNFIRTKTKHEEPGDEAHAAYVSVRDFIICELNDRDLSF